ncbi:glycosyltransferase family 2 protein [Methanogenium organophilum]|uniref:Glycosyltransferase family 2 protein n=1 Tax=Methanogenium organophilum TaxID=2199 RepID=A0A9X9S4M6_METOG|nr:glycosyltransferase family 2 protein [Methanogenium organophilum]WAI00830.1 glycosyltransferase family 2 protein [Methanogenium organophilum]
MDSGDSDLRVSVAMCTYNGERYLEEQLVSIANQTRLPDELVICDDGSTDDTIKIANEISKQLPFFVRIYENPDNLGVTKNFEKAIKLCKGDIIFLSDQDDILMPEKIEKILNVFRNEPDIGYVFSDAQVVDEELHPLGYTMWKTVYFKNRERKLFSEGNQMDVLIKHRVVTGATMAINAKMIDSFIPIPDIFWHDEWISFYLSTTENKGKFIEEPLIRYRQHSDQVIGGKNLGFLDLIDILKNKKSKENCILLSKQQQKYTVAKEFLLFKGKLTGNIEKLLDGKITHLQKRQLFYGFSRWKRVWPIIGEVLSGRYIKYSHGYKSVIVDLFLPQILADY